NRSHWSTSKTPSYTKSVSWQHHLATGFADHAINKVITYFFKVLYSSGINIMTSP
ncbi:hypothetical protein IU318_004615, partial [Escherichia coli]|nr:hypothetical protein [Escherichia coli]